MTKYEVITKSPRTIGQLNPKGVKRFGKRLCISCRRPIMGHWMLNFKYQEQAEKWYCYRDGTSYSEGMSTNL